MKNFVRVALMAIFVVACVLFSGNENVCSAIVLTDESSTPKGRLYSAGVLDIFFQSNKTIGNALCYFT